MRQVNWWVLVVGAGVVLTACGDDATTNATGQGGGGQSAGGASAGGTGGRSGGAGGAAGGSGEAGAAPVISQRFQGIGVLPGRTDSTFVALSRDGSTVIGSSSKGNPPALSGAQRFVVGSDASQSIDPPGATDCSATAVNGDGTWIVGQCASNPCSPNFRWTPAGAQFLTGDVGRATITGVNSAASILAGKIRVPAAPVAGCEDLSAGGAGGAGGADNSPTASTACRWEPSGKLLLPADCPSDSPFAISADGSVLGFTGGVTWSAEHGYRSVGGCAFHASGMSGDGKVLVGEDDCVDPHGGGQHVGNGISGPAIWQAGWEQALGGLAVASSFDGARLAGDAIFTREGGASLGSGGEGGQAPAGYQPSTLEEALGEPLPAGWKDAEILAISDDGKVVAGNALHDGHREAWVARLLR